MTIIKFGFISFRSPLAHSVCTYVIYYLNHFCLHGMKLSEHLQYRERANEKKARAARV